jgi:hypothetical protein
MERDIQKRRNEIISDACTLGYKGIQSYEDIQTWLREVHNIDVTPVCLGYSYASRQMYYRMNIVSSDFTKAHTLKEVEKDYTYFEALEIGIYEALNLLKLNAVK